MNIIYDIFSYCEVSSSTFKKTTGESISLSLSNSALIKLVNMTSNKSNKYCTRLCQIDSNCATLTIAWNNMTCYLFRVGATSQIKFADSQLDMFIKYSDSPLTSTTTTTTIPLITYGLIHYWPIHNNDYTVSCQYSFLAFLN